MSTAAGTTTTKETTKTGSSGKPLESTIEAPRMRGVTTKAREERAAEERPASEKTLGMMPGVADLARELGVRLGGKDAGGKEASDQTEEEHAEEDEDEDEEEEREEVEGERQHAGEEEEEDDDEEEQAAELPAEAVKIRDGMQKRIDKLTAVRGELEDRVKELEGEVAKASREGGRPAVTEGDPLGYVLDEAELDKELASARQAKQWALRNRDGVEVSQGEGKEPRFYTAEEVSNILANAEEMLDAADTKRTQLREGAKGAEFSRRIYAPFFEKGTPAYESRQELMKSIPKPVQQSLQRWRGDWETILIDAMMVASTRARHPKTWFSKMAAMLQEEPAVERKNGSADAGTEERETRNAERGTGPQPRKAPPAPGGRTAPKTTAKELAGRKRSEALRKPGGGNVRELTAALLDRLAG